MLKAHVCSRYVLSKVDLCKEKNRAAEKNKRSNKIVGGLDRCSFRTRYHTQVPEIGGKLNGKKISFHMGHITAEPRSNKILKR
jgi:hypothetical protein